MAIRRAIPCMSDKVAVAPQASLVLVEIEEMPATPDPTTVELVEVAWVEVAVEGVVLRRPVAEAGAAVRRES
jgi:hypothetical protein